MDTEIPYNQYNELIPLLNAKQSYNFFEKERTALTVENLPFFSNYDLLVAQTFSTIPPVKFHYLWNNQNNDVIALDGTRDTIFENLEQLGLTLNNGTIIPYVRFVLDCIWTEEGSLRLIEKVEDIDFSDNPSTDDTAFLQQNIHPATFIKKDKSYEINCIIIYDSAVYQSTIVLKENGLFDVESETELKSDMNCLRVIMLE